MVPRRHESSDWPLAGEDAVLALSAVVTREGRIQSIDVLAAEQARALKVKPEVVLAMIDAASRAQFEPARAGGAPVAVSMVWLLAHTTVVGSAADVERLMRPLAPSPEPGLGPQCPASGGQAGRARRRCPSPRRPPASRSPAEPPRRPAARAATAARRRSRRRCAACRSARTTSVLPCARRPGSVSVSVSARLSSRPSAG